MKKTLSLILAVMLLSLPLVSCGSKGMTAEPFEAEVSVDTTGHILRKMEIVIEDYGTVSLTLDETVAPITVKHFIELANSGYYNGSSIIRLQEGFVLQGGSSNAFCESIKGEFSSNGIENNLLHKKGIISMARTNEPDTATSQFFIMLDESPVLDGDYAAFGWVTSGMNIVETIEKDITFDDLSPDYYGYNMGFLKESSYITITAVNVIE